MEWHIGRKIKKNEVVHHKNEIKTDNRLENLQLMTRAEHSVHHATGKKASEKTKAKFRLVKKGTSQKEQHPQWRKDINEKIIIKNLVIHKKLKVVANALNINVDTLRARINYYNINWKEIVTKGKK